MAFGVLPFGLLHRPFSIIARIRSWARIGLPDALSTCAAVSRAQNGVFVCPSCGKEWSHDDRVKANQNARLLHDGQTITSEATIEGDIPRTDTLGFRWSAVHNLFLTAGDVAADEWRARRSPDEENAEREMRQFVWCLPVAPTKWNEHLLEAEALATRILPLARGIVPSDAQVLTAAIDLGKYLTHWIVVTWRLGATGHVVDYGRIEVASDHLGVEQGLLVALREFRAMALEGWRVGQADGRVMIPSQVWIDEAGPLDTKQLREVFGLAEKLDARVILSGDRRQHGSVERGAALQHRQWYNRPTHTGAVVKHIGESYHINWLQAEQPWLVEVDADHWKMWVHQRVTTPLDKAKFRVSWAAGKRKFRTNG